MNPKNLAFSFNKVKAVLFIFSFFTLSFGAYCQALYKPYEFPDNIPDKYKVHPLHEYNELLKSDLSGLKPDEANRFAEEMSYRKAKEFSSGYVYLGWEELEDYLNEVLQKLIPENQKKNSKIHVYPARSSEYNASAIHDGTIFFNISLFAGIDNEAALACILGHELSHYLNQDVKKSYIQRIKLRAKKNRDNENKALKALNAYYSRAQERAADSVGAVLAAKAGYDINYGSGNFYKFIEIDKQESAKENEQNKHIVFAVKNEDYINPDSLKSMQDKVMGSHPQNWQRLSYYKNFIGLYNSKASKDFLIDKPDHFRALQEKARIESLRILIDEYDNRECVERAFTYHLLDPDNENYVFYILEGLRRYFMLTPKAAQNSFLTDDLKPGLFAKGDGILHNLHALVLDTVAYKMIKAKRLLDTKDVAFETYEEAFDYFADLAIAKKFHESLFPIALRNSDTIPLRDQYLKEYLSKPGMRYEAFSKALLDNTLTSALKKNTRQLVLHDDFVFLEDHSYGYHDRFILAEQRSPSYVSALKDMVGSKFRDKEVMMYSELSKNHIGKAIEYHNLLELSAIVKRMQDKSSGWEDDNGEKKRKAQQQFTTKLFMMNPDFWDVMHDDNLKSIDWISAVSFDDKSKLNLKLLLLPLMLISSPSAATESGSSRYAYLIEHYAFSPFAAEDQVSYNEDIVSYKMTKGNYLNTVYHALKSEK